MVCISLASVVFEMCPAVTGIPVQIYDSGEDIWFVMKLVNIIIW
jgi:hypothetical protein